MYSTKNYLNIVYIQIVTVQIVPIQIVTTVFLWLITYNNIMIILYHWNSHPLLHTIQLVYCNNHHLYKHYVKLK